MGEPAAQSTDKLSEAVKSLITTYHDQNPDFVEELSSEPSPLQFMRYVARNRPFIIREGAKYWDAVKHWSPNDLIDQIGDQLVDVAITPYGNADSIVDTEEHGLVLAMPHYCAEKFCDVVHRLQTQELDHEKEKVTRYMQAQNDNLRNDHSELFKDVPSDIPFARIALDKGPDAINFWLGNSCSTTALHKDNYENIYAQIFGRKHFVLLPPVESACVNEQRVLVAQYAPKDHSRAPGMTPGSTSYSEASPNDLALRVEDVDNSVPCATWDPDKPNEHSTQFSKHSRPLRITLNKGDMLYLPALWYHKVSQSPDEDNLLSCSVNYWYDLEFSGPFWSLSSFASDVGQLALGRDVPPKQD